MPSEYFKDGWYYTKYYLFDKKSNLAYQNKINNYFKRFHIEFYILCAERYISHYTKLNKIDNPEEYGKQIEIISEEMFVYVLTNYFERNRKHITKNLSINSSSDFIDLIRQKDNNVFEYLLDSHQYKKYDIIEFTIQYIKILIKNRR